MNKEQVEKLKQECESLAERYGAWKIGLPVPWTFVAEVAPIVAALIVGALLF